MASGRSSGFVVSFNELAEAAAQACIADPVAHPFESLTYSAKKAYRKLVGAGPSNPSLTAKQQAEPPTTPENPWPVSSAQTRANSLTLGSGQYVPSSGLIASADVGGSPQTTAAAVRSVAGARGQQHSANWRKVDEPAGTPGYMGLEEQSDGHNWQLSFMQQGDVALVRVVQGSPAYRAGIRTGDYVLSINGGSFGAFIASRPAAGTLALVKVHRPGVGDLLFDPLLAEVPREKKRQPAAVAPAVMCGDDVARAERLSWFQQVQSHVHLKPVDKLVAGALVHKYLNAKGFAYPAHETLAKYLKVSVPAIKRAIVALQRAGLLEVTSGKSKGQSNYYAITWPRH